jgi:hypothetical protein
MAPERRTPPSRTQRRHVGCARERQAQPTSGDFGPRRQTGSRGHPRSRSMNLKAHSPNRRTLPVPPADKRVRCESRAGPQLDRPWRKAG